MFNGDDDDDRCDRYILLPRRRRGLTKASLAWLDMVPHLMNECSSDGWLGGMAWRGDLRHRLCQSVGMYLFLIFW